jgi:8-oxo-(d)GTP phosphatase
MPDARRRGPVIKAAGALLWRPVGDGGVEHLVLHRTRRQDWSLPKGKLEPGEHAIVAAVREVGEETGDVVALGRPLPTRRYPVDGQPKQVRYWVARAGASPARPFEPNEEVDALEWLPPDEARARLSYPHDAELVDAFARGPRDTVPLVLLRHAKAVKRSHWDAPDLGRPLEPRGVAQAQRLVPMLGAYGVRRVHSSDAERCRSTVLAYAKARDLELVEEPTLSEEGYAKGRKRARQRVAEIMREGEPLVLCTHRPVLPDVVRALLGVRKGHDPAPLPPGAFFVVHRDFAQSPPRVVAVERHRS